MLYAKVVSSESLQQWDTEKIKVLSRDMYHPVDNVSMGQSYTTIFIEGVPGGFNSSHFKFYKVVGNEFVEHCIYSDPYYNPYL